MQSLFLFTFIFLLVLYAGSSFIFAKLPNKRNPRANTTDNNVKNNTSQPGTLTNPQFVSFQQSYFLVYFLILLADWLNQPYHYKIYYDFKYLREQIAVIYVCGYLASIIFSPIALTLPDRFGRKFLITVCGLIYAGASIIKCINSYFALFLSRILSATSSSVLFAVCESWYVHEHLESYDFPVEWLSVTLDTAAKYNGLFSVLAGILSFVLTDILDMKAYGPSILSAGLMVITIVLVQNKWRENRGSGKSIKVKKILGDGLRAIIKAKNVLKLCIVQALVEGVIYVFIFLWTPTLIKLFNQQESDQPVAAAVEAVAVADSMPVVGKAAADPVANADSAPAIAPEPAVQSRERRSTSDEIPLGMVFATFMLAMMLGGKIYEMMTKILKRTNADVILYATTVSTASMYWLSTHQTSKALTTYLAYVLFELSCGAYFPSMAALRNRIVPQKEAQAIGVWVRIPLNSLATAALIYLHTEAGSSEGDSELYLLCCGAMGLAAVICFFSSFKGNDNGNPETTSDDTDEERGIFMPQQSERNENEN